MFEKAFCDNSKVTLLHFILKGMKMVDAQSALGEGSAGSGESGVEVLVPCLELVGHDTTLWIMENDGGDMEELL